MRIQIKQIALATSNILKILYMYKDIIQVNIALKFVYGYC